MVYRQRITKRFLLIILFILGMLCRDGALAAGPQPIWIKADKKEQPDAADTYVAFRGRFTLKSAGEVELHLLGASWFNLWLDGQFVADGPARFPKTNPEYDTIRVKLAAGEHVLAAQVHYEGLSTRLLMDMPPFFACKAFQKGKPVTVAWRALRLAGYTAGVRRINPQLAWIEWCDTRQVPAGWLALKFDDSKWSGVEPRSPGLGEMRPLSSGSVRSFVRPLTPVAQGPMAETFGYENDNPSARFFLSDLACDKLPPQGVWRRYDLGRVRLGRPRFTLDLPAGAVIEFAASEALSHGRVAPWITLSCGDSCNLDHYVARGGVQEFFPLTPKGGRFLEVHVRATPDKVRFVREEFVERGYHDAPQGSFHCDDPLLERIWAAGIETYRGCTEDALIDNPTRERGQWTGDVVSVGMEIASAGYADLRLCRRALVQSAQCANGKGMISGLCPGGGLDVATYALEWVPACLRYWELTGDRTLLSEMYASAERNMVSFDKALTEAGLVDDERLPGGVFVDWGYVRNQGPADMAVTLYYLEAARGMVRWSQAVGREDRVAHYQELDRRLSGIVSRWFAAQLAGGADGWEKIGYHCTVLGLRFGFLKGEAERGGLEFVKKHMLRCFPNDPRAPRLGSPEMSEGRLITPYFGHYALPELIRRGQMDFVLGQYRTCWGWMLEDGRTTWVEVFDTRWSHCHQWAGCPTWQLSQYGLGLHPRFDLGKNHFVFNLEPGSLKRASGRIPLPDGSGTVDIRWQAEPDGRLAYEIRTPEPIRLHVAGGGAAERVLPIGRHYKTKLVRAGGSWTVAP